MISSDSILGKVLYERLLKDPLLLIFILIMAVLISLKVSSEKYYLDLLLGGYIYYFVGWTTWCGQIYGLSPPPFFSS